MLNLAYLWEKLMPSNHCLQSSFVDYDQNYIKPVTSFICILWNGLDLKERLTYVIQTAVIKKAEMI